MVKRYGKEVTGVCTICGNVGKTEMHHIISQSKIGKLQPGNHNYDQNLKTNPGNLVELCVPCHDMTDHSRYRAGMLRLERMLKVGPKPKKRAKKQSFPQIPKEDRLPGESYNQAYRRLGYGKKGERRQCNATKSNGNRCGIKNRAIPEGGFCHLHRDQADSEPEPEPEPDYRASPMPPLRGWEGEDDWEENFLDAEHMAALVGIHRYNEEVDDYVLELFEEWPEAWHRRWLRLEKW